ncbi:MAG: protein kinase, partial [Planctomycetota bacterium]|nr:protein kinase [Planctomycetota bacterium]
MNGPASRNAQNIALARLAVSFGIPQNNAELCFNEAEQRGSLFTDVALARNIISLEQAQYLLQQLGPNQLDNSGLLDTIQANLAGPQNFAGPSHFHGQQTPVAPQAYVNPPTPTPQSHPGFSHGSFPGQAPPHGGPVADVMIPQPAQNQPSTGQFIRPHASQFVRESTGVPQYPPPGHSSPGYSSPGHTQGHTAQGMSQPGASVAYSGVANPGDSVHQRPLGLSGVQPAYPVTPVQPLPGIHMSQAHLPAVGGGSSHDSSQPSSYSSYGASGPSMIEASLAEEIFEGERYEVSRTLSDGKVLAKDRRIGREVVMCYGGQSLAEDALATFYRAAQVLAHLDHAAIPKVHDIGHNKDMPFYTQDCVVGHRLKKGLDDQAHEFEKIPQVLRAFLSMVGGIVHAHEQGIIHTQLSPGRIYLGEHGQVMITDWEQALIDSNAPDSAKHLADIACPRLMNRDKELKYLAPEISNNRSVGARADVWGLGSLL